MTQPPNPDHAVLQRTSQPSQADDGFSALKDLQSSLPSLNGPVYQLASPSTQPRLSSSQSHLPTTHATSLLDSRSPSQRRSQSQSRFSDGSPARSPSVSLGPQLGGYRQLISRSFAPRVAVFASPDTEEFVRGKGFKDGLCGLLRPYGENVPGKVVIRDSVGGSKGWDGFGIRFIQAQILQQSSTASVGGASGLWDSHARVNGSQHSNQRSNEDPSVFLEASLSKTLRSDYRSSTQDKQQGYFDIGGTDQERDADASPFYQTYLRRVLSSSPTVPHETFSHPVACLIAVSSHNPAPIDALRQLYASTGHGSHKVPEWMGTEYLRYYVLIHDEENDDITKSTALFDLMKRHFGLHCHLLRLKSSQCFQSDDDGSQVPTVEWLSADEEAALQRMKGKVSTSSFPRGRVSDYTDYTNDVETLEQYIPESDATAIKTFLREMVMQSIVPFMENRVMTWNDQVASRRRGISGRFMSLSKRWTGFGSAKAGTSSPGGSSTSGSNYNSQEGYYPPDTPEATMRQLADYAFMLRDWKLAYTTYDLVRADFGHDKAWQYHAAANEMAAITSLLSSQNSSVRYRSDLVDQMLDTAVYSYLTRCAMPWGVIRCLALAVELLRSRGPLCADDAARWGGKLLELDVLRPVAQVLTTERIADCYISRSDRITPTTTTRRRQAAFWNILASSGWSKLDMFDLAQHRLREATSIYESANYENANVPFPSMRPFWNSLMQGSNAKDLNDASALIDTHIEQQGQLDFSTLGEKQHAQAFVRPAAGVEDVDLEGFTTQDAGHVFHEKYYATKGDDFE